MTYRKQQVPRARRSVARGVSLVEALVAFVVAAVGMLALAQVQVQLRLNADVSRERAEAVRFAQAEMEKFRAFSVLDSDPSKQDYNDIVAATATAVPGQENVNTTFNIARAVNDSAMPAYKTLSVTVSWAARNGEVHHVTIDSAVSKSDPALGAQLTVPPTSSAARNPMNRNIRIPVSAVNFSGNYGAGHSGFTPPGATGGYYVFNNADASIIEYCTGNLSATSYQDIKTGTDQVNTCVTRYGYTISGFINIDLRNNISAISPGTTACGLYEDLQSNNLIASTNPTLAVNGVVLDRSSFTYAAPAERASDKPREYQVNNMTLATSTPTDWSVSVSVANNITVTLGSDQNTAFNNAYFKIADPDTVTLRVKGGSTIETFQPQGTGNTANGKKVKRSGDNAIQTVLAISNKQAVLTIDPTANLAANTVYELVIKSGSIQMDKSGANADFNQSAIVLTFSTGTLPVLSTTSPSPTAGGTLASASSNLTMTFDRNVVAGTGSVTLYKSGTAVESFNVATGIGSAGGTISFSGPTVTINPYADLQASSTYSVQVASTAVRDAYGFYFAGINNNTTFFFTTGSGPTLASTSPATGAQITSVSSNLTLTFSGSVSAGTGIVTLYKKVNGNNYSAVETFNVATGAGGSGGTISFSGNTVTIDPGADLLYGGIYAIQIDPTAIRSSSNGYNFAGIADNSTFNFTTAAASSGSCPTSAAVLNYLQVIAGTPQGQVTTGTLSTVSGSISGVTSICYSDAMSAAVSGTQYAVGYFCVIYVTTPNTYFNWSDTVKLYGPAGWLQGGNSQYKVCRYHDLDNNGSDTNNEHPATYSMLGQSITDQNFLVVNKSKSCPNDTLNIGSPVKAVVYYNTAQIQP